MHSKLGGRGFVPWSVALTLAFAAPAHAQTGELRWAGEIADVFAPNGTMLWTCEDGGRIRRRALQGGLDQFQSVPSEVKDTLLRVFFLPDNLTGWAVGQNGWVIRTLNGGTTWSVQYRMPAFIGNKSPSPWEELWDVHFVDQNLGFLVGLHWMWCTSNGGASWTPVVMLDAAGNPLDPHDIEMYCVDALTRPASTGTPGDVELVGLAGGEPGFVLRTDDGMTWQVVFDVHSLCPSGLPVCAEALCDTPAPGEEAAVYEPWDIEISRSTTSKLALVVGGVGTDCGLVFSSTDDGASWNAEEHECKCSGPGCTNCAGDPLYNNDPSTQLDVWRLKKFSTLYGVGILDGDNTAVASGYSGQHVVRDAAYGVWRDRSSYSNDPFHAVGAVTLPLFGADADAGGASDGRAVISGMGGFLRASVDGGQTWSSTLAGEPWRIRDVHFLDATRGWQVGQFFRIASTLDAGRTWTPAAPEPEFGTNFLTAVSFAGSLVGVAVGEIDERPGPYEGKPKILVTQDGGQTPWLEPSYYQIRPFTETSKLNEVNHAGGSEWWAVGDGGLMLHSQDHGASWYQFGPPGLDYPDFKDITFESVAFASTSLGMFVGFRYGGARGPRGVAFVYRRQGNTVTWTDVTPNDPFVTVYSDVDMVGTTAYLVGERTRYGVTRGVFYSSNANLSAGDFTPIVALPNQPHFANCDAGDDLESVPVLTEVEIAPDGDVWVAGECGRVWQFTPPGLWVEHKSSTDAHVRGMSFPAADTGFLGCHRASNTGQSVVRFRP